MINKLAEELKALADAEQERKILNYEAAAMDINEVNELKERMTWAKDGVFRTDIEDEVVLKLIQTIIYWRNQCSKAWSEKDEWRQKVRKMAIEGLEGSFGDSSWPDERYEKALQQLSRF